MTQKQSIYRKYLDPKVISHLATLDLRARMVVEGFIAGLHKSPYHGFSVEFSEHRQYMPGDDFKHIDWKVYGKTDRFFVKQYEEETNLKAYLLIDASASMVYSSHEVNKFQYATYLAAALTYLMLRQRDAVGLVTFDEKIRKILPARSVSTYLPLILAELEKTQTAHGTAIVPMLHEIAERIKRRSLIMLFSDLYDENTHGLMQGLKHFRHRKHEVIVFHILDPLEVSFDFKQDAIFEDLETRAKISTQPIHIRREYQRLMGEFIQTLKKGCRENNIDYVNLTTTTPFDLALVQYLQKRKRLGG
ncbi:MAG: DUF58 domain-containing protein [Calditrichaeota bacterium]|nr:MAG: DUF58 domain-containing protein [Calditrichota bacterium]